MDAVVGRDEAGGLRPPTTGRDPMVIVEVRADATDDEVDAQADEVWRALLGAAGIGDG